MAVVVPSRTPSVTIVNSHVIVSGAISLTSVMLLKLAFISRVSSHIETTTSLVKTTTERTTKMTSALNLATSTEARTMGTSTQVIRF